MASQARKLPIQANLSLTEVVNHLEKRGDLADADALLQANGVSMASSAFLKELKEELLDRKSKERADKMTNLRSKQMQVSKLNLSARNESTLNTHASLYS
jgi:hypothetical protein